MDNTKYNWKVEVGIEGSEEPYTTNSIEEIARIIDSGCISGMFDGGGEISIKYDPSTNDYYDDDIWRNAIADKLESLADDEGLRGLFNNMQESGVSIYGANISLFTQYPMLDDEAAEGILELAMEDILENMRSKEPSERIDVKIPTMFAVTIEDKNGKRVKDEDEDVILKGIANEMFCTGKTSGEMTVDNAPAYELDWELALPDIPEDVAHMYLHLEDYNGDAIIPEFVLTGDWHLDDAYSDVPFSELTDSEVNAIADEAYDMVTECKGTELCEVGSRRKDSAGEDMGDAIFKFDYPFEIAQYADENERSRMADEVRDAILDGQDSGKAYLILDQNLTIKMNGCEISQDDAMKCGKFCEDVNNALYNGKYNGLSVLSKNDVKEMGMNMGDDSKKNTKSRGRGM